MKKITYKATKIKSKPIKIRFYTKEGKEVDIKGTTTKNIIKRKLISKPKEVKTIKKLHTDILINRDGELVDHCIIKATDEDIILIQDLISTIFFTEIGNYKAQNKKALKKIKEVVKEWNREIDVI